MSNKMLLVQTVEFDLHRPIYSHNLGSLAVNSISKFDPTILALAL